VEPIQRQRESLVLYNSLITLRSKIDENEEGYPRITNTVCRWYFFRNTDSIFRKTSVFPGSRHSSSRLERDQKPEFQSLNLAV
jgi:hypothetical protein